MMKVMRFSAALVAVSLSLAYCQDLDRQITYTGNAVPLRAAVDAISKQSGVKLKVDPDLEEEPIFLRLEQVPMTEALSRIADVFAADWVDHGDYRQLEQSEKRISEIRAALLSKRVLAIKESMDKLVKTTSEAPPLDQERAEKIVAAYIKLDAQAQPGRSADADKQHLALAVQLPATRFGAKILATMDPSDLATIGTNERAVYSTNPNEMQRPLGAFDPAIVAELNRERDLIKAAVEKLKPNMQPREDSSLPYSSDLQNEVFKSDAAPARFLVRVDNMGFVELAEITVLDEKGNAIAQDYESIGADWNSSIDRRTKNAELDKAIVKDGFDLSPMSKELLARLYPSGEVRPLNGEARQAMLSPTTSDPLSIITGDTILIGAAQQGLNVVALVPDECDQSALSAGKSGRTSLDRYKSALEYYGASMTIQDGWLTIKPLDPRKATDERMPRAALQKFVQDIVSKGTVSIEDAADLKISVPRRAPINIAENYATWLVGQTSSSTLGFWSADALRLYGTLSDQQREAAADGGVSMAFHSLPEDMRQAVYDLVLNNFSSVTLEKRPDGTNPDWAGVEKTDYIPSGIQPDAQLIITEQSEEAVYPTMTSRSGSTYSYAQTMDMLVPEMVRAQHSDFKADWLGRSVTGYRLGTKRTISISLQLSAKSKIEDGVSEARQPDGPLLTLDELLKKLKPDVRKMLEQKAEKMYESTRKYRESHGAPQAVSGGGTPPPR